MQNRVLDIIFRQLIITGVFRYLSGSQPRQIRLLRNGGIEDERGQLTRWFLTWDDSKKAPKLVVHSDKPDAYFHITANGVWRGRLFGANSPVYITPPDDQTKLWSKLLKVGGSVDINGQESSPIWDIRETFDISSVSQETTAISIIGYNRPDYFERVVKSIAHNKEADALPIYVFLDKEESNRGDELQQQHLEIAQRHLKGPVIIRRPFNFGCGRNIIDVRRQMFDHLGYDRLFVFEDDLVISPDYMTVVTNLLDWGESNFTNIGAAQGWNYCDTSKEIKEKNKNKVKSTYTTWWGYLQSKWSWDKMKSNIYKYEQGCIQGPYDERNHHYICRWFRELMKTKVPPLGNLPFTEQDADIRAAGDYFRSPPSGQDAITMHTLEHAGLKRLTTHVNRGRYIGVEGIHMNRGMWDKMGFAKIQLDYMPGDDELVDFVAEEPEKEGKVVGGLHYVQR